MSFQRGQLLRWKTVVEMGGDDKPCVLVRGPYEGYFEKKPLTELVLVVDVLVDNKVIQAIPAAEFERWV